MADNFLGGGLNNTADTKMSVGYGSLQTGQIGIYNFLQHSAGSSYDTVYTVPAGLTYHVSTIIFNSGDNANVAGMRLATGAGGAEVDFIHVIVGIEDNVVINFPVPLRFEAGTRISLIADSAQQRVTIQGFVE